MVSIKVSGGRYEIPRTGISSALQIINHVINLFLHLEFDCRLRQ